MNHHVGGHIAIHLTMWLRWNFGKVQWCGSVLRPGRRPPWKTCYCMETHCIYLFTGIYFYLFIYLFIYLLSIEHL